jgi:PAS domain S-box-containing protein
MGQVVILAIVVSSIVVLYLIGAIALSLRYLEATLFLPTIDQVNNPNRPWYISALLWKSRLMKILVETERLKQSEFDHQTRYKILTDNVAAAVILHQPDGTVLWCSPYTEVLTGFSVSDIYRDKATFLKAHVHDEDREVVEKALAIVATGEPFQCRYRFYHKSGISLWLETRTVPIYDHVAQEYVALSIALDVTASVHSQLKVEERNRDLNEFTYMISHDLKAPIVTLRGMLSLLEEETRRVGGSGGIEPLDYMSKAIHRLEQLVGGVLELARVSTTERVPEPIPLSDVVTEVLDDHRFQLEQCGANVVVDTPLPIALGNRTQLYQIVGNLVSNAIKYRRVDVPLTITIGQSASSSRRRIAMFVSDNGRGIASEYLEHIFQPFNRAGEGVIEGSGVGLACVKRLVEKLSGTITVKSQPMAGATFTIELRKAPES